MESTMDSSLEYTPLKWPPNIELAQIHFNCCKPGIENPEGFRCPCCGRQQKLVNNKWLARNITKDYKNYGGGVIGYFYLMAYCMVLFVALIIIKVAYHMYILQKTCPLLQTSTTPCTKALGVFRCCDNSVIFQTLKNHNQQTEAMILQGLQLASYLILVIATLCIRLFFQAINRSSIGVDDKLYSRFSIIIKGVPLYYQLEDLQKQFKTIDPEVQVVQIFYLHRMCDFDDNYRKLFDMHFEINSLEDRLKTDDRQFKIEDLRKKYQEYLSLYELTGDLTENQKKPTKKVIVVFNTIEQKEKIHKSLRMNEFVKFWHYIAKILNIEKNPIDYYSERISEPQEIYWKYIGESSTNKQKARLQTTLYGVLLIIISFAVFYFPMIKIDEEKIDSPGLGSGLGVLISTLMIVMSISYRLIILRIMPSRKPSNKITESYFIVMTTIVFHFFFYLITPATFYIFTSIPKNYKLKQLFMAVFIFVIMNVIVALLDIRYRLFKMRRQKLLGQASLANMLCQQRLHEQITPPSFPIEFKLMVVYDIWAFNSFYIFQLPQLLIFFLIALFIIFWIDKHNIYQHYKMQYFLSIDLELKVQKAYFIIFLICVSIGYFITTQFVWQRWLILGVIVISLLINVFLDYNYKQERNKLINQETDIKSAIQRHKSSVGASFHMSLVEQELKRSFIVSEQKSMQFSSVSIASQIFMYSYNQTYNLYLKQFKNKEIGQMLQKRYLNIKHSKTILDASKRRQSQMARLEGEKANLDQKLIAEPEDIEHHSSSVLLQNNQNKLQNYQPPTIEDSKENNISKTNQQ